MRRCAALATILILSLTGCSRGSERTAGSGASPVPAPSATATTATADGPSTNEAAQKVDELLDAYRGTYPGAVVLIRVDDETRVVSGGHAVRGEPGTITERHRFPISSVTKTMVAAAVLQLVEEGKLNLNDSVEDWLPGLVPRGDRITIEQLLAHRSGLYNYTDSPRLNTDSTRFELTPGWKPLAILRLATNEAPVHAPDTQSSYSNTNYIVLGLIVERITGKPLDKVLQQRIFAPAGMNDTSLATARVTDPPRVHGYAGQQDVTHDDLTLAWAAGGVVSSARDLDAFLRGLTSGQLLDAEAFA